DDQEQADPEVDLRRAGAEVVDRKRRYRNGQDGHDRVGVGVALRHPRPQHLEGDEDNPAADAEQPAEQAAQETDRREDGAAIYSGVVRIGVSGWFTTTEWWRNST